MLFALLPVSDEGACLFVLGWFFVFWFLFFFSYGGIVLSISIPGPPVQKCIISNMIDLTGSESCAAPQWLNLWETSGV